MVGFEMVDSGERRRMVMRKLEDSEIVVGNQNRTKEMMSPEIWKGLRGEAKPVDQTCW